MNLYSATTHALTKPFYVLQVASNDDAVGALTFDIKQVPKGHPSATVINRQRLDFLMATLAKEVGVNTLRFNRYRG